MKYCLFIFLSLTLVACNLFSFDNTAGENEPGVWIGVFNSTNESYENAILQIGVMQDDEFVKTESLVFPTIPKGNTDYSERTCYETYCLSRFTVRSGGVLLSMKGEYTWKPKNEPIRLLSDTYYFLFKMPDGRELLIKGYEMPENDEIRVITHIYRENDGITSWTGIQDKYID